MAQHYRAEWDSREAEIGERLGGAFDVTAGTALFGRPANPDADTVAAILSQDVGGAPQGSGEAPDVPAPDDTSVVDLRGSSMIVQPLRPHAPAGRGTVGAPATTRWAYDLKETDEPPPPKSFDQLKGLAAYFVPWLGKWYWETVVQGTANATAWRVVKNVPGQQYAKALVNFHQQRTVLTEDVNDSYTRIMDLAFGSATDAARILGSGNTGGGYYAESYWNSLGQRVRAETTEFFRMAFEQHMGHVDAPDVSEIDPTVSGEGNMVALNDVPEHVDNPRVRDVLFGPIKNTSSMVTERSINGLPESYGPPPE